MDYVLFSTFTVMSTRSQRICRPPQTMSSISLTCAQSLPNLCGQLAENFLIQIKRFSHTKLLLTDDNLHWKHHRKSISTKRPRHLFVFVQYMHVCVCLPLNEIFSVGCSDSGLTTERQWRGPWIKIKKFPLYCTTEWVIWIWGWIKKEKQQSEGRVDQKQLL